MDEQTAIDLVLEDYYEDAYEMVEDWVDEGHFKHDSTHYYNIVLRKGDNTYWKINFISSYEYGLDEYSVYAHQVEKKEIVTAEWVSITS